jgi:hypothetical protein
MALESNFQPRSEVEVLVAKPATTVAIGAEMTAGTDVFNQLQITDYNIEHASAPIDVAPPRSGIYGQIENQGHHRPDNALYEVTLTMRGTPTSVLSCTLPLFGVGASPSALTAQDNTGVMQDGSNSADQAMLVFLNAGSDATANDVVIKSCFCTSMTMREDVGTNGGEMVVEATFVSAYQPEEKNFALTSGQKTADTDAPKNIFDLNTYNITTASAAEDLTIANWEITIARPLARVHYQPGSASFDPYGYVQTGPYEVTGSLNVKRDDAIFDLVSAIKGDSTGVALNIAESSGFTLSLPDIMIDNSKPEVGDFLTQTIPFRAFGASESASIISITIS